MSVELKIDKEELKKSLRSFEEKRLEILKAYQNTRKPRRLSRVFGGIAFVVFFYNYFGNDGWTWYYLAIIPFLILWAYYGSKSDDRRNNYIREFERDFTPQIIKMVKPSLTYQKNSSFDNIRLYDLGLIDEKPNWGSVSDEIKGKVGETAVFITESNAVRRKKKSGKNKGYTYTTLFKGLFVEADFNKSFQGETYILPDKLEKSLGWLAKKLQKLSNKGQLVNLENPEFEKKFAVYSSDQVEARYILSPKLMERFVLLHDHLSASGHVELLVKFENQNMHLAISWSKDFFEIDFEKSVFDEAKEIIEELRTCLSIIEELDLNTRIWGKS